MKKCLCMALALLLLVGGCSRDQEQETTAAATAEAPIYDTPFRLNESGNIISPSGIVYSLIATEPQLYYLGELRFAGPVEGEATTSSHITSSYQTGMYAIKDAPVDLILVRRAPDNEWFMIYRDASLPPYDYSADRCSRVELVKEYGPPAFTAPHKNCGGGIVGKEEVAAFISEVKTQISPQEAGLYELIKKPDGTFENCHIYFLFGYFEEEPDVAIRMEIKSYNDLAYSITIDGVEYVLPNESWEQLSGTQCS